MMNFGIRRLPPLVGTRPQLTADPYGPRGPGAEWLPRGWESRDYPVIDDIEVIRQWLGTMIRNWEGLSKDLDLAQPNYDITAVRDAHRLVRHLQSRKSWTGGPAEPERTFTTARDDMRDVVAELKKIQNWINDQLKTQGAREEPDEIEQLTKHIGKTIIESWFAKGTRTP